MIDQILDALGGVEDFFWAYVGAPGLMILGFYLSFKSRWFQIRQFPKVVKIFKGFVTQKQDNSRRGVAPIYAFFASVGGAIGIGNLVGVCTAVQIGGPGAVFWMWMAALLGMLVKYGEIYLGIKFRIQNDENSYAGGPMIYLKRVPGGAFWSRFAAVLMCLYGIEIFIFRVVTRSVSIGWNLDQNMVIIVLLIMVVGVGKGGVRIVGRICSVTVPVFLIVYTGMGFWVIAHNISYIPSLFYSIFIHAFTSHAALGAFAGSTVMASISHGVRRACYAGDIGIGYASTMHSETTEAIPAKQAAMGIIDIFLDSFVVCTMSLTLILLTGMWHKGIDPTFMVSEALSQYFSYVGLIWPFFIFLLGYSTLISFFAAGRRSATILFPKYGSKIYIVFASVLFLIFSFLGTQHQCFSIMSILGSLLLICNLYGLFFLRDEVVFDVHH